MRGVARCVGTLEETRPRPDGTPAPKAGRPVPFANGKAPGDKSRKTYQSHRRREACAFRTAEVRSPGRKSAPPMMGRAACRGTRSMIQTLPRLRAYHGGVVFIGGEL